MRNVLLNLLLLIGFSCQSQSSGLVRLGADDFEKEIAKPDAQVLDLRTASEFSSGHLKNALQANWADRQQFIDRTQYIDKEKTVYIYCLVGNRSTYAAEWLRNNGFKNIKRFCNDGLLDIIGYNEFTCIHLFYLPKCLVKSR